MKKFILKFSSQFVNKKLIIFPIGSFQKRSILPPRRKFLASGGGGEEKLFLIIVIVLGHPKGVGGLTSYFLCGGGMDVFWNDPLKSLCTNFFLKIFWCTSFFSFCFPCVIFIFAFPSPITYLMVRPLPRSPT